MFTTWTYQKDNSFTFSKDQDGFHLAIDFNTDEELIRDAFTPLKHPVGEHDTLIDYFDGFTTDQLEKIEQFYNTLEAQNNIRPKIRLHLAMPLCNLEMPLCNNVYKDLSTSNLITEYRTRFLYKRHTVTCDKKRFVNYNFFNAANAYHLFQKPFYSEYKKKGKLDQPNSIIVLSENATKHNFIDFTTMMGIVRGYYKKPLEIYFTQWNTIRIYKTYKTFNDMLYNEGKLEPLTFYVDNPEKAHSDTKRAVLLAFKYDVIVRYFTGYSLLESMFFFVDIFSASKSTNQLNSPLTILCNPSLFLTGSLFFMNFALSMYAGTPNYCSYIPYSKDKTLDANGSLKNPSYDFYGQNVKSNKIINSSDSIVIALLLIKILYWISLNTVFKEYWHIMFSMRKLIVIPLLIGLFITNQFNYLFFIYHIFTRKNLFNPLPNDFSLAIQDVPKKDED